jgi:putative transposase
MPHPDNFTQLNIHCIFATKGRSNCLPKSKRPELFRYMSGILEELGCFTLAINGYSDHVHLFFELNPDKSISEIIRVVKSSSSKWINQERWILGKFEWQRGYGAFSYSKTQRPTVIAYIANQEEHHNRQNFKEEYLELLNKYGISLKDRYLFEFYENSDIKE